MREHQIGSLASHWRTTAALIAVGLGLLSAIPTGGSGLIAGVAAGAAVLGTAYSLATLYDDYQDYSLASAEHLSTLDQTEDISQEEPSLMWLAGDLLDVGLNIVGAASAFKTLRGAMVAAEKGGLKALPELIKTTERSGLGIASRSRVVSTVLQRTGNQSLEQTLKAIREGLAAAKPAPGKEALLDAIKAAADKLAKKQIARIGPSGARRCAHRSPTSCALLRPARGHRTWSPAPSACLARARPPVVILDGPPRRRRHHQRRVRRSPAARQGDLRDRLRHRRGGWTPPMQRSHGPEPSARWPKTAVDVQLRS